MKDQLITMLQMQDAMNSRVNPDWRKAGNAWYRAIWTECAEMLDHYGWKWWKHQEADLAQVKLELVDIFHFAMSEALLAHGTEAQAADAIQAAMTHPDAQGDFRSAIERLAMLTLQNHAMDFSVFADVMQRVDMRFDDLYRTYVGKNVLNFFRQDHGYQDGTYTKVWNGREDNEHLAELLAALDSDSAGFRDELYQGLRQAYRNR